MIRSFANKDTEQVFLGNMPKGFQNEVFKRTRKVLERIAAAHEVMDLRFPPSQRLEKLHGDRKGVWSVRVNDQYRVTFRFEGHDAFDVRFEDYH